MPQLRRLQVAPSAQVIYGLVLRGITSWIPTGFGFFSKKAADNGELAAHTRSWAKLLTDLKTEIHTLRNNVLLSTASGNGLDDVGQLLKTPRNLGENDEVYAQRLAQQILAARLTPNAMRGIVSLLTSGARHSVLYEPWTNIKFRGDNSPRSGRNRRLGPDYIRPHTFEVQVDGEVPTLQATLDDRRAAGIKAYQAVIQEGIYDLNDDPFAWNIAGFGRSNVASSSSDQYDETIGDLTSQSHDTVAADLAECLDIMVPWDFTLPAACGLTGDNLSRNCLITVDMLRSAATGIPVYGVSQDPYVPDAPTDIQPGVQLDVV